jgi:hypothetical protein
MTRKLFPLLLLAALGASCTHLASVSVTSIPANRGQHVSAERYKFLFLLLNFNNDFVQEMERDLAAKCPKGKVEGIVTKLENITYFPIIAHAYNVTADGYCVAR